MAKFNAREYKSRKRKDKSNGTYSNALSELAEDYAPKTEEERKEEMVEEALGIEEKGGLTEGMEEVQKLTEEMVEELAAEDLEVLNEAVASEKEMLSETELLLPEVVEYKSVDILI